MIEATPCRLIGPFPNDVFLAVLRKEGGDPFVLYCNGPYDDMICKSKQLISSDGMLKRRSPDGLAKKCIIADREGLFSFMVVGKKSAYDYGAGMGIHSCLAHGVPLFVEDEIANQADVEAKIRALEREVIRLFPLPQLNSTSKLRAACELMEL